MDATTARISLIVPTRNRPAQLDRFLHSLEATTARPDLLEVVLVVDRDDPASLRAFGQRLPIRHVIVEPGLTMGALNMAGYEASSGHLLMLLNDDVIARTPAWDSSVRKCFTTFPEGILLVHVNDTVFRKALCTFPIVSRTFCELTGGICPHAYRRYRIDDHIEELFNLLGVLGERRSLYLPDVVFEHCNHVTNEHGTRQYFSDPAILPLDAAQFDTDFERRKRLALLLKRHLHPHASKRHWSAWQAKLDLLTEGFSLRRPERLRVVTSTELSQPGALSRSEPWLGDLRERAKNCVRDRGYRGLAAAVGRRLLRYAKAGSRLLT